MATGIVYYSRSGNTRFVAEQLSQKTGGKLIPLEERGSRGGLFGFLKSGFQASTRRSSRLSGEPWSHISGLDHLYLLSPIWAGNASPAINAFLDHADLRGLAVYVVTLQADPNAAGSERVHQQLKTRIEACGGDLKAAYALRSDLPGRYAGEDHLRREADKLL